MYIFYFQYLLGMKRGERDIKYQFTRTLDCLEGFYVMYFSYLFSQIEIFEIAIIIYYWKQ